ncbi:MAG: hypothetical protein QGG36_01300 [Pirellulaceae bacterium]|jgi:hypothetical protein|nr:hypothetical protein [Pirellulaceae bacterium]MDP7014414.1 hypothetical protein [Pirellulaceae bacterium]
MDAKAMLAVGALAAAAVGGSLLYESMTSESPAVSGDVDADLRPSGKTIETPQEAGSPLAGAVVGESVFLKRPTLDMSRAVSTGTLTAAAKLKRDRERAARARRYREAGFQGTWRGLSPFAVNESVIAKAMIQRDGSAVTGWLWVVTEFKKDGVQCAIVELAEGRRVGDQLSFRAQGQIGAVTLSADAGVANGTFAGRKVALVRIPK